MTQTQAPQLVPPPAGLTRAEPLSILVVADDLYPGFGGQAAATEGFVKVLLERGYRVTAVAGREEVPSEPAGLEMHRLPSWRPGDKMTRFVWPDLGRLRALVARHELVHAMTPTPLSWLALGLARAAGRPALVGFHTQRESLTSHVPPHWRPAVAAPLDAYYRAFYRRADLAIAPSEFARRVYREYSSGPCAVVSNGVDLETFDPSRVTADKRAAFRTRLGLAPTDHLVLSVGRLSQEKDPLALLRVGEALARRRTDTVLALGGTGPLRATLEAEITRLGLGDRVRLLGFVPNDELPAAYASADLFALASPTELQGIVLLEAMAMGCALFVADLPTSAATEALAGGTGLTFDPADPEEAAARLDGLLGDASRLAAMRAHALAAAREHDVRASVDRLETIYRLALGGAYRPQPPRKDAP